MAEREYLTRKGELLARLEWGKLAPGWYQVEGRYHVKRNSDRAWTVTRPRRPDGTKDPFAAFGARHFDTMTDALEHIAEKLVETSR